MLGRLLRNGAMLALAASLQLSSAQAEPVVLKFAAFVPDAEQTVVTVFKPFIDAVNKDGEGVVKIEFYPNGALGRSPLQQAQMVLDGVADIAWVVASYTPGRFQENEVFELPGQFQSLKEATTVISRLVNGGKIKGYEQYFPIGVFASAPYSLHSRVQVRSLAQLQGKKFRVAGAIEGEALKSLGAVPVGMPPTEVPESVSRGTIDGSTSHPAPLFDFGIVRVTRYHYFMPLGVVPLTILMNRKKFDSLPPKAQEIIRKYSGDWTRDRFISGISAYNEALLDKLRSDPQHTVTTPTAAEVAEARTKFDTVTASWADRSARNAELLKLVRAEIEKVRKGQ